MSSLTSKPGQADWVLTWKRNRIANGLRPGLEEIAVGASLRDLLTGVQIEPQLAQGLKTPGFVRA